MKIQLYPPLSIHEIGQRTNQEDALWPLSATPDNRLFIVCDGMGGHEKGEVASQTVCKALGDWFQSHVSNTLSDAQLSEALTYAYEQLDLKDGDELKKMGTTLTLLYIHEHGITAAHIGDSRIYHIRPNSSLMGGSPRGTVLYQSRDHSLVFDLFQAGEISYDEMATHPKKNIITRAMQPGEDNRVRPDVIHIIDILPDDYFYMCSDGMLEQMNNEQLVNLFSATSSDEEKRQQLIKATEKNQDNHTAWIIHVKGVTREEDDALLVNEEPTARCNAVNITPVLKIEDDNDVIEEADDDDVIVVSTPKPTPKQVMKKLSLRKIIIGSIAFLILMMTMWFFLRCNIKGNQHRPKPMSPFPSVQHSESSSIDVTINKTDKMGKD